MVFFFPKWYFCAALFSVKCRCPGVDFWPFFPQSRMSVLSLKAPGYYYRIICWFWGGWG
jgi:hypothetical protein